ncbi:hypothetical protein J2Z33_002021 [Rubellimicrobium aerolatum]|nr:hypothetical protein [Rubellimicrobium aerolatum]
MLSLALMAVMALALATLLGLTGRASLRVGEAGAAADLLLARHTLRGWIEAAPRTAAFEGDAEALRFEMLTDAPPFSAAEPSRVSLTADDAGAAVVEVAALDGTVARRVALSSGGGLRIGYFGDPTLSAAPTWQDEWPATAGPPDLVRIEYAGPGGPLPPLTVIPALLARQSEMSLSSPPPPD